MGAIPGHRPQEHIFTIKSIIAIFNKMGIGVGKTSPISMKDLFRLNSQNSFHWCHWASNSHKPAQQTKVYFHVMKVNYNKI